MNLNLKNLMDFETAKVMLAAIGGLGATAAFIDWTLRAVISVLTICYLWRKIRNSSKTSNQNQNQNEDDERTME